MTGRVAGKKALVYGGGTGIGFACARALVKEGAAVFLSSRRETVVREAARQLCEHGSAGHAVGDATEVADVKRVTVAAAEFMGGIDTLVISAGAGGRTPIFDTEPDEFQRIVDNTLRPIFLGVRYASPHLLAAGKASVIVISSMYGLVGQRERVAYCGAKAGANGMVKSMARRARGLPRLGPLRLHDGTGDRTRWRIYRALATAFYWELSCSTRGPGPRCRHARSRGQATVSRHRCAG